MYKATDIVTTLDEIRDVISGTFESQEGKVIDHVDPLIRAWIERAPYVALATVGADGFVKVVDEKTLAIPDRPGNHRFDSFRNILETGRIGAMFLVPNRREVVRVSGNAEIVRDAPLREAMAINGRVPDFAILVRVEEAFYHCGKAAIRSGLWSPGKALPVDGLPTYAEALVAHGSISWGVEEQERRNERNERERLYDE